MAINEKRYSATAEQIAANLIWDRGLNDVPGVLRSPEPTGPEWQDGGDLEREVRQALARQGAEIGRADIATRMHYRF